jgi:fucose permease
MQIAWSLGIRGFPTGMQIDFLTPHFEDVSLTPYGKGCESCRSGCFVREEYLDAEKRSSGHYLTAVVIWIIMTIFVVYSFSLSTAAGVFLPSVRESLGLSDVLATYVLQAFVIAYALMQIPAGYFIDNLRARWVVSLGVCVLAIGALLQSMSSTTGLFVAANFIQGIGGAFSFIAAGALIGQWFPIKQFHSGSLLHIDRCHS